MASEKTRLAKNSLIYALFSLLQKGFAFFLIPIYTAHLTISEYGILGIVMAAIPFFVLIAGLAIRGSTAFFYYEYKERDKEYLKNIWGTSFITIILFSVVFSCLLWLIKDFVLAYFLDNIPFYPYLFLALISVSTQPLYYYYQSILKAKQQARAASVIDFIYFVSIVALTIFFILYLDYKADGALLALAITNFLFFVFSLVKIYKEVNLCFDPNLLKRTLKYSLPIIPHNLASWAMNLSDRLILNSLTTLSVVGLFDIGSQLGKLINIITLGVNSAYSPWFFQQLKESKSNKNPIAEVTHSIVLFYIVISTCISWLAPEILRLIASEAYYSAWKVVPFIAIAFAINGFYYTFSNVFFIEKTKFLPLISGIGAIINIGLNFVLIPVYGMLGSGIACLLSKIIFTFIAYFFSQRLLLIPYNLPKILSFFLLGFLISISPYLFQSLLDNNSIWFNVLIKLSFLGICIMPVLWIKRKELYTSITKNFNK